MDSEKTDNLDQEKQGSNRVFYKSPLGFEYTELEEIRYQRVLRETIAYMKKFGKGVMPLVEGYATRRKKFH